MKLGDAEAVVQAVASGLARQPDPEAVDALYRSLPRMECKGKCASACGPVPVTPLERRRIAQRGHQWVDGKVISLPGGKSAGTTCSALDQKRLRCRVYEERPMVCRLWGLVKALECPWGCVPEGGHLDDIEGMRLLNLSQWHGGAAQGVSPARWEKVAAHPRYREVLVQLLAESRPVREEPRILQATIRVRPTS
ncbi:YkgJ family cysteine cluster protein [Streptomyces scabiei]|uniref:YkgJ family cysteine cluster protein n=1 Tax=Streptomyces scabiei TaxID=1930 RepID=UPI0033C4569E